MLNTERLTEWTCGSISGSAKHVILSLKLHGRLRQRSTVL